MLISIDSYYNVDFYNQCLSALKNNGVEYTEYMSITGEYKWYLDIPRLPVMVNYDVCPKSEERYLVNKVNALEPDSEYRYYRRNDSQRHFQRKYMVNDAWSDVLNTESWLIKFDNKETLLKLSIFDRDSKIWYLGRYLDGRIKIALIKSDILRSVTPRENVLLEKRISDSIERFETEINYRILMGKERLKKFSSTPYIRDGRVFMPIYYNEMDKRRFLLM